MDDVSMDAGTNPACDHLDTVPIGEGTEWRCRSCGMTVPEDPRKLVAWNHEIATELREAGDELEDRAESTKVALTLAALGARYLDGEISMEKFTEDRLLQMVAAGSPVQVLDMLACLAGGLSERAAPLLHRTPDELLNTLAELIDRRQP